MDMKKAQGFTIMEALVTIAIIGVLASLALPYLFAARTKARDQIRLADMNTVNRLITALGSESLSDAWPAGLPSDGDLILLNNALQEKYKTNIFFSLPHDPNASENYTRYLYHYENGKIVIYANLEDRNFAATLPYHEPTLGGGKGSFIGEGEWAHGANNTDRYYQVSN